MLPLDLPLFGEASLTAPLVPGGENRRGGEGSLELRREPCVRTGLRRGEEPVPVLLLVRLDFWGEA